MNHNNISRKSLNEMSNRLVFHLNINYHKVIVMPLSLYFSEMLASGKLMLWSWTKSFNLGIIIWRLKQEYKSTIQVNWLSSISCILGLLFILDQQGVGACVDMVSTFGELSLCNQWKNWRGSAESKTIESSFVF